jgi:two-component system response regulator VicR
MAETILVVDDEQPVRELLKTLFEREGHDVIPASDGEEAVRLAEREHPHLIILDGVMPKLDGIKTCAALKANQKARAMPIILVTGSTQLLVKALQVGVDDFVTKPFHVGAVLTRVRAMLKVCHIEGKAERAMAYMKELRKDFSAGN